MTDCFTIAANAGPLGSGSSSGAGTGSASGLAGPGSVAWKINCETVLLLGWARAILLQLAHPLVAAGVAEHSRFLTEPRGRTRRLRHTLDAMLALTFGTRAEAHHAAWGINAIHDRVHGVLAAPAGPFPAGTRYSAHDPALLCWVHATLLDTFPMIYEQFVGPLSDEERDRYCREASGLAPLLGVPGGHFPASIAELRRYMAGMMASGTIVVSDTARGVARELLNPRVAWPLMPVLWPALWLARLPAIGTLPPGIREQYGLAWTSRQEKALRIMAASSRRVVPWMPVPLRIWPAARRAFRRMGKSPFAGTDTALRWRQDHPNLRGTSDDEHEQRRAATCGR